MAVSITVADNAGSPTGVVVTVAGSTGGTVSVRAAKVDEALSIGTWSAVGSRTGNGTVSVSLAEGFWFFVAIDGTDVSAIVRCPVTDGQTAVATRCRAAIRATLATLSPTTTCCANLYEQWDDTGDGFDVTNVDYPAVVLTTAKQQDGISYYGNMLDGWARPTALLLLDNNDPKDPRNLAAYELWRQNITRAFVHQRLSGVPEVRWCDVEPLKTAESYRDRFQLMVSSLVVRVNTREIRGLGA